MVSEMVLAAHQPCYLPWLGYFHKIARADRFVLLDHVQFERQNFQNRNRIRLAGGVRWLTVPVVRGHLNERICDKQIALADDDWRRRTWMTLAQSYRRAPHFARYAPELEATYARRWERLVDLDLHLLALCARWLELETPMVRSSTLGPLGQKTELIGQICERLGADVYLSGTGGSKAYLDLAALQARGIRVAWQEFVHPVYPQQHAATGFVAGLSVLDLLFNCGPASRDHLLGAAPIRAAGIAS